jgi:hypothetical protein
MGTELLLVKVWAERNPSYYAVNVIGVMFLIVQSNSLVYTVPVHDTADRSSIAFTLLLTAVAYKFVVAADLPKIGYLTLLDKYIVLSFGVLALGIVEIFVVSDSITPDEDTAQELDAWFYAVITGAWLLLHIVLACGGYCSLWCADWERVDRMFTENREQQKCSDEIDFGAAEGGGRDGRGNGRALQVNGTGRSVQNTSPAVL